MTDVLYVLVTLAAFAGFAVLVGALDRTDSAGRTDRADDR